MHVALVNPACDSRLRDPNAVLARYTTLTRWARALADLGVSITIVQQFHADVTLMREAITIRFCRPDSIARAVAAAKPDLVHVNGLITPALTVRIRRRLARRAALVLQDHGGVDPEALTSGPRGLFRRWWYRMGLACADAILFTDAAQAEPWRANGLIGPTQPVEGVLESGIDPVPRRSTIDARRSTGMTGDPAILWVGRLDPNKDPLTVLAGVEQFCHTRPAAMLTMIFSEQVLLNAVVERIRESSVLASRVRLVGAVPHASMAAFYAAADLFVLGSHREAAGYALLEACAAGLPPVVTDIPSFAAITGRTIGWLWRPGDACGCASALERASVANSDTLTERVLEHARRSLTWPAVATRARSAYETTCERRLKAVQISPPADERSAMML